MILVTGGTGLVGSHLLFQLTKKGQNVRATYRRFSTIENVKTVFSYYTKDVALFERIEWIEAPLNDIGKLSEAFVGISKVYHCAACISFDPSDYRLLRNTNIKGTANVVNLCVKYQIQKLCYVSTIATLGFDSETISEEMHWQGNRNQNVYAISKYGAEMEVWRGTQEGVPAVIVNPGVIIGPGCWNSGSGLLFKLAQKEQPYFTNGVTGFVAVRDVTTAMIELMQSDHRNERFILVSENKSYLEIMTTIATNLKVKPPSKLASKTKLEWAWRLDWMASKFFRRRRRLTKPLALTLNTVYRYDNSKIKSALDGFEFQPISESLSATCQIFSADF